MNRSGLLTLNALAVLLFGAGLVAPLTPSEGAPGAAELLVFAGAPAVMLQVGAAFEPRRTMRAVWAAQLFALGAMVGWLAALQSGGV